MNKYDIEKRKTIKLLIVLIIILLVCALAIFIIDKVKNNENNEIEENNEKEKNNLVLNVGDYVNYTYDEAKEDYSKNILSKYTGYSEDQTYAQTANLKWQILSIDNENNTVDITIASDEIIRMPNIWFSGASGYNNAVFILNDICENLYSNTKLGTIARSINLNDIEQAMNEEGIQARNASQWLVKYGETYTYTQGIYPSIYKYELEGVEQSDLYYKEPTEETVATARKNGLTVKQTFYYLGDYKNYFDNEDFYNLIYNSNTNYWLSTRATTTMHEYCNYSLDVVMGEIINQNYMIDSNEKVYEYCNRVRPVVTISIDNISEKTNDVWQIEY